jgi:hypothetical protein
MGINATEKSSPAKAGGEMEGTASGALDNKEAGYLAVMTGIPGYLGKRLTVDMMELQKGGF